MGRSSIQFVDENAGARRHFPFGRRRGFTLIEMLVVISIIVIVVGMSIPLFRAMSTDRSVESGQNIVSAMLQRARSRALGLQSRRGIFFFEDQVTKKTAMVMVRIDDPSSAAGANPGANVLELDEESDEFQFLPSMVGSAFVLGATPVPTANSANGNGTALGANSLYKPYGLIAFDEAGRVMSVPSYTIVANDPVRYPGGTRLKQRYQDNIGASNVMVQLGTSSSGVQFSSSVVLLYDKVPFAAQDPSAPTPSYSFTTTQNNWLDNNGLALSVNRYNGTIINSK